MSTLSNTLRKHATFIGKMYTPEFLKAADALDITDADLVKCNEELLSTLSHNEQLKEIIERNRAAIDELVGALKPFAHCATIFDDENRSGNLPNIGPFQSWHRLYGDFDLTVEDLRNARAAITKHTQRKEQA